MITESDKELDDVRIIQTFHVLVDAIMPCIMISWLNKQSSFANHCSEEYVINPWSAVVYVFQKDEISLVSQKASDVVSII